MALPLFLGLTAATSATIGTKSVMSGAIKNHKAHELAESTKTKHNALVARYNTSLSSVTKALDSLGMLELEILGSFSIFADAIEQIHNRPIFYAPSKKEINLNTYTPEELVDAAKGADILVNSFNSTMVGIAGGIATSGATMTAVSAFGTASTGTAITALTGVAKTNATMAALGGGALSVGGGGMALGSLMLGTTSIGVGIALGGFMFDKLASKKLEKQEEISNQIQEEENFINGSCNFFEKLKIYVHRYFNAMNDVNIIYKNYLNKLQVVVANYNDWNELSYNEKLIIENCSSVVFLLYNMCKVPLVYKTEDNKSTKINYVNLEDSIVDAVNYVEAHKADVMQK